MNNFWVGLWTVLWFGGLGVFSILTVLVVIFGGRDLAALLASLSKRHGERQEEQPTSEGEVG